MSVNESESQDRFLLRLELLESYARREGHACVPVAHKEMGFSLGRWVAAQRSHYHASKLSNERVNMLESLEGWVWRASDHQWEQGLSALRSFKAREGHVLVPNNHIENRFELGRWVDKQRKRLKNHRLRGEQSSALAQIGVTTENWRELRNRKRWEKRFKVLEDYVNTHESSSVPRNYVQDGVSLGVWVNSLRSQHSKGALDPGLAQKLEGLTHWVWAKPRKR